MSLIKNHYYHNIIRNFVVSFGQLFSGIQIQHTGAEKKLINVPISYFPKEKWFVRRTEDPDLTKKISIDLPRITFEITGYRYDSGRKVGQQHDYLNARDSNGNPVRIGAPVPYEIDVTLTTFTGTQDESLQILEQILPYFSPAVYLDIDMVPEYKLRQRIPVILDTVQTDNNYQGLFQDQQMIIQSFSFIAKINLVGPIDSGKVIKRVIANEIYEGASNTYTAQINPFTANENDPYNIDEIFNP